MAFDSKTIIRRVLEELGQRELALVQGRIGSRTLRNALRLIVNESEERADLFIPHYWAVYYHDGHGRVSPITARKLVFFDDPNDDPRAPTPERESQVRRLTREQYEEGLRRNQERAERGLRPFMYVVDSTGPSRPRPFFQQLERGAARRADAIVPRVFERELLRQLADDLKPDRRSADFRLG